MSGAPDVAPEHCSKQIPAAQFGPVHIASPARTRPPAACGESTGRSHAVAPAARSRVGSVNRRWRRSSPTAVAYRVRSPEGIDLCAGERPFPTPDLCSAFGVD